MKTGLGDRIATYFVKWLGKSTLGLSYGLTISEALIAPAMPSTTARAGGVFLPIIKSLSLSGGSLPNDKSSKKLGSYLIQSQFQVIIFVAYDLLEHNDGIFNHINTLFKTGCFRFNFDFDFNELYYGIFNHSNEISTSPCI